MNETKEYEVRVIVRAESPHKAARVIDSLLPITYPVVEKWVELK